MNIEEEVQKIKERNRRVEIEKAWETSMTRRLSIAVFTYVIATIWLITIDASQPFLGAAVPTGGYLLSTWSLPFIRKIWNKRNHNS